MSDHAIREYLKTFKGSGGAATTVTVAVGSTTTGNAGTNANVINSGDSQHVVLDFTIPRGSKGDKGDKGDTGEQGVKGDTGSKGDKGDTGNGIASTVLNSNYTLTITFTDGTTYTTPSIRGAQGIQGIQGEQGVKGDTGATGNGIASTVLNSDYTLTVNFTDGTSYTTPSIRGAQGIQGIQGVQGEQGVQGNKGDKGDKGDAFTYSDFTTQQIADLRSGLSSYYSKLESSYTTTSANQSTIPIGITDYRSTDILLVDINGLDLVEDTDYTISGTNIVLTTPISTTGQVVHFVALRSVAVTASDYANLKGDKGDAGVVDAYPRSGATPLSASWLSETSGGSALTPEANQIYILMADSGEYTANAMFRWNGSTYEPLTSGGTASGTSVPTADEIAAFDSSAKMNSTDMTSAQVSDFVDSLNVSGVGFEDISSQITFGSAWTQMVKFAWKTGNLVFFQLEGYAGSFNANTQYTMATIASGYGPSVNCYATGHQTDSSFNPKGVVNGLVRATGAIDIRTSLASSSGQYIILTGFYLIG